MKESHLASLGDLPGQGSVTSLAPHPRGVRGQTQLTGLVFLALGQFRGTVVVGLGDLSRGGLGNVVAEVPA